MSAAPTSITRRRPTVSARAPLGTSSAIATTLCTANTAPISPIDRPRDAGVMTMKGSTRPTGSQRSARSRTNRRVSPSVVTLRLAALEGVEEGDNLLGVIAPGLAVRVAVEDREHLVVERAQLVGGQLVPAIGGGCRRSPWPVPVGELGVPALEPALILGDQLAPEGTVRLDQPAVVGVERPLDALVRGPPPALAPAVAVRVVLDEAVLGEDAQVVAGGAARLAEPARQLRGGGGAVPVERADQADSQRMGDRAKELGVVDVAELRAHAKEPLHRFGSGAPEPRRPDGLGGHPSAVAATNGRKAVRSRSASEGVLE